jgi:hypothetical protein
MEMFRWKNKSEGGHTRFDSSVAEGTDQTSKTGCKRKKRFYRAEGPLNNRPQLARSEDCKDADSKNSAYVFAF